MSKTVSIEDVLQKNKFEYNEDNIKIYDAHATRQRAFPY